MNVVQVVQLFTAWFAAGLVVMAGFSAWRARQFRRFVRQPHPPIVQRVRWPEP